MSALLEILAGSLGRGAVEQISAKLGLNPTTTGRIVQAAIPLLVGALARNSSSSSGATALQSALTKDHDGSVLDDVLGFLGSSQQGPGAGILRHKPNIKWGKDRGKEPERPKADFPWFWSWDETAEDFAGGKKFDGNRWNDCHYTNAFKQAARERARGAGSPR